MKRKIPRLVIAATQSGAGKTTLVTGLLAALRAQGLKVQSYKVGGAVLQGGTGLHRYGIPCARERQAGA